MNISSIVLAAMTSALPGLPSSPGPTDWPMYQKNIVHSGAVTVAGWNGDITRCAEIPLTGSSEVNPIVVGDYVFFHVTNGGAHDVEARDRFTGASVWKVTLPGAGEMTGSSLTYYSDKIYYFGYRGWLFCLDAHTGATIWSKDISTNTGWSMVSSPTIIEGVLYQLTLTQELVALDPDDGTILWSMSFPPPSVGVGIKSDPAYEGGILYFGSPNGHFYAVDVSTQTIVLDIDLGTQVNGSPSISGDKVFIGVQDGTMYAIRRSDGSIAWTQPGASYISNGPAIRGNEIAWTGDDRQIRIADMTTGLLVCPMQNTIDNFSHMCPIWISDHVVASGCAGGTHDYDRTNCVRIKEETDPACSIFTSIVSKEGYLYAIDRCDRLIIWCPAIDSPTPTPTISTTSTPTFSDTFSPTQSPSPTFTPTLTVTTTDTKTASPTSSNTPTWSPTRSNTSTWSPTISITPTSSPTSSSTPTPSSTSTDAPTHSPSMSDTPTFSATRSITPTFSPTPTPTWTKIATFTVTPTWTKIATITITPTYTFTPSPICNPSNPVLFVEAHFDPENSDQISMTLKSNESIDCLTAYLVVQPHGAPKGPVTIGPPLDTIDGQSCEGSYLRFAEVSSGFGDIDTIKAYVLDNCGNLISSDGSFDREVISNDCLVTRNRINPNRGESSIIQYQLLHYGKVNIRIYNEIGELVRTLVDKMYAPGRYQVSWDGTNNEGRTVASDIYYVVVDTPECDLRAKIFVIK